MVMELGQAKRSELSRSNISLTSLAREPVVKANPMGSNWTESEDYALFVGSKQKPIDWVSIASGLKTELRNSSNPSYNRNPHSSPRSPTQC
ncbi:hypothetical protein L0F63_000422 [Massospora cicadina]|nr:hypothetical protein L0F63_000422 [Massospora cicadina]